MTATPGSSNEIERRPMTLVAADNRHGFGGKVIGVANAGRRVRVGIALHHIHVLGPTGTGKTSLLLRMVLDDVHTGRGVAVFDPAKGDLIRDLLDRLPADCADRLVVIDPDETNAPPAINLLDPAVHGGAPHDVAAHITSVMSKVWHRWWGDRMTEIAYHGLLTLARLPGSTLAHLPRLLSDAKWRAERVQAATDQLDPWESATLAEFWDGFNALPAGQRAGLVAPLLSRLRLVLAHPLALGLFGVPATTFRFADILDGGVLLCRLPKGVIGEDGTRLIGSLLLAGLWQATAARARIPEDQRLDAACYLDECQNFLHLPIGIGDALAEARGLRTSFVLAHQYLGQLTAGMAEAVDANARNKVYFALAPRDAANQARHIPPWLDDGDLTRLGGFEVVLRPIAGGRAIPPVTADTLPPPPLRPRRSELLRRVAREHTGLSREQRRALRSRGATSLTTARPNEDGSTAPLPSVVGHNTFTDVDGLLSARGERSNEGSNEGSNDQEHAGQHAPLNTPYPLLPRGEEDWWTGTD